MSVQLSNSVYLAPEIMHKIDGIVYAMKYSGTNYEYSPKNFEDFASSIHNLVCLTQNFGAEGARYQTKQLREALTDTNVTVPADGDFIYFGGRCFPITFMFASNEDRLDIAQHMAEEIVGKIGTVEKCSDDEVADALAESAALDNGMLFLRTSALVNLLNERYPEYGLDEFIGNFVILPDGSLLSLHYMYANDGNEDEYEELEC